MNVRTVLTDKLYLSLIGVILVFVVGLAYLFSQVLDVPLTSRAKSVEVELASTGGLFEGSAVTYRGVKVGKVKDINLSETGVVATITLTKGSDEIPLATRARVRSLSPVGEQYLDLQPKSDDGPYLKDGSRIAATSTDLPKTLASTVVSIQKVLDQIDDKKLNVLLTELSTGLAGTGQDVGRLVDQGDLILADLERLWPETDRLLTNGGTVLDITTDKAAELRRLGTSARQFAAFLRNYDPELRRTLNEAPGQFATLEALVKEAARELPPFLKVANEFGDIFTAYDPHFRALLAEYAPGLGTLSRAVRNGFLQIHGIPQRRERCMYGTPERSPRETDRRPLVRSGSCPGSFPELERGAAHAPGPIR